MATECLDNVVRLLNSYGGRDKTLRTIYYALVFIGDKLKNRKLAEKLLEIAKQLSTARLIGRQFGDILLFHANLKHWKQIYSGKDRLSYILQGLVNLIYQVYHPVEHVAWLSSLDLVPANPDRWWPYTVMIWNCALAVGIFRSLRIYVHLILNKQNGELSNEELAEINAQEKEELWNLLIQLSDFMNAINFLPKGFLWSQTFPRWKVGIYGFIASLAGLLKMYKNL